MQNALTFLMNDSINQGIRMLFIIRLMMLFLIKGSIVYASEIPTVFISQKSWIESANDPLNDFPIQNLPYGVFKFQKKFPEPRICVAIGNYILDLKGCVDANLLNGINYKTRSSLQKEALNEFMGLDKAEHLLLRQKITTLLKNDVPTIRDNPNLRHTLLFSQSDIELLMPIQIGDYTDFYASIQHASHVGSIMRPDNPLMPNYKHMPIGYHGRSSSVVISGNPIAWPSGQILTKDGIPVFSESLSLDYELEMGAVIGAGNIQGNPIALSDAQNHIFGFVLLNDWSARDIQKWEYQPLGPFNGKNFATTISPWIVTIEALKPFQQPSLARSENDPPLLSYLTSPSNLTFDIVVEAYLSSEKMRDCNMTPLLICKGNLKDLYWTFDQMVCHHTISGCNLRPGDLLGSGTISGSTIDSLGCLLERVAFKLKPLELPDGTLRNYLEDNDEIILHAYAEKDNYPRVGFGVCRAVISKTGNTSSK